MPRLMAYNIEWFTRLFVDGNKLWTEVAAENPSREKAKKEAEKRLPAIAEVIARIDPDVIGITEAPNTTTTSDNRDTVAQLEAFAAGFGLRCSKALIGFPSRGTQEIALLYDPAVFTAEHSPGGQPGDHESPPFNQAFHVDSDGDGILEIYEHYRPPLEVKLTRADTGAELWLIVVHAKSKGIFDAMDRVHFERNSERNRRKLFAECTSIRRRVDEWQDAGRDIVVMGDINDGPGFDWYESRFGRSAVEIVMGDIFQPEKVLANRLGAPKWGRFGWNPSTARFTDQFTGDLVNALIDHIVASTAIAPADQSRARVWNPWQDDELEDLPQDELNEWKGLISDASDHIPVTLDIP